MGQQIELTIKEPCHENWDAMTPSDKGKFCSQCQKQVIDFTGMSDRQLAEFFKKPSTGSVCGRFMMDQLERDIDIPRKRIPWIRYFFKFALPAFLLSLKTNTAKAQGRVSFKTSNKNNSPASSKTKNDTLMMEEVVITTQIQTVYPKTQYLYPCPTVPADQWSGLTGKIGCGIVPFTPKSVKIADVRDLSISALGIKSELRKDTVFTISGVVKDMHGEPLAGASVMIPNGNTGTATNNHGEFSIKIKTGDSLLISYIGYDRKLITDLLPGSGNTVVVMEQRLQVVTMGLIVTVKKKKKKSTPALIAENNPNLSASGNLKIYPNPLATGQPLTVDCKKTEPGAYSIQLISLAGQTVYQEEELLDRKKDRVSLNLPSLQPGEYILVFTHLQTGKKYTGKVIIQ